MEEDPLVVAAFSAARAGRVEELDAMLEAHPDLIERRSDVNHHHTLLIIAAWHGRTGVTLSLIERGAQVNAINDEGRTALWFASCGGHLEVVRLLMAHAADPSVRKEGGSTALMAAAWTGHVEVAAYILNKAEDPSKLVSEKNRDGCGALWFAAAHGKLALVKLLLQRGADVLTGDIDGFQPSKVARLRNHVDCAELLENAERAYIVHLHRTLYDDTCTLTNLPRGSTRSRTVEKRQRMTPWYLKARTDRNRPFPEADTLRSKKRNSQSEMLEETAAFVVKELRKELVAELLQMFSYPV